MQNTCILAALCWLCSADAQSTSLSSTQQQRTQGVQRLWQLAEITDEGMIVSTLTPNHRRQLLQARTIAATTTAAIAPAPNAPSPKSLLSLGSGSPGGSPTEPSATAGPVTDDTFEDLVLNADVLVLVDFWASWCGPCKTMDPIIDELAMEYGGKLKAYKLNTDENPTTPVAFGLTSIPTVMFFKGGQKVDTIIGAVPETALVQTVGKAEFEGCQVPSDPMPIALAFGPLEEIIRVCGS